MRPAVAEKPSGRLEHDDDRGLVVRAEDRSRGVADDAVLDDRLDRRLGRDGVRVRAEEDRRSVSAVRRGQAAEDVSGIAVEHRRRVILVPLEPETGEVTTDPVRDRPLLPRRARHRAQLEEEIEERRGQLRLDGVHVAKVQGVTAPGADAHEQRGRVTSCHFAFASSTTTPSAESSRMRPSTISPSRLLRVPSATTPSTPSITTCRRPRFTATIVPSPGSQAHAPSGAGNSSYAPTRRSATLLRSAIRSRVKWRVEEGSAR